MNQKLNEEVLNNKIIVINYLTRHIEKYFEIESLDYISSWSGIRALIDDKNNTTKKIMRGHIIEEIDKNE